MDRFDIPALLEQLTIEEKAALVSGSGFWHTRAIERLGIPSIMVSDGPHGLRKQGGDGDHVGLGESVPATCFPTAAALGSSWDVDLVERVGVAIGAEAVAQGIAVVLGPGINIKRSPSCGRNFEYLSEDPRLAGELGTAMVRGIQSQGVGTSLKHFAVNNQEPDRLRVSAVVDDRTLREIYLAAFERVVKDAAPTTVMCSYNRINGTYASQDRWLLTELLRGEWGFDGLVVSDWGAVDDPVAAVAAGLDLEMPSTGGTSARTIVAAVAAGELDEGVLDTAIERLLTLIDRTLPAIEAGGTSDDDGHHRLAREAAADCVVLLENESGLLPLTSDSGRLAVIGEFARTPRYQGAGSSKVNPTRVDDALSALVEMAPVGVSVGFAAGFGVDDDSADADALLAEAVALAADADTVVCFLGLPASHESEGFDRTHIDLPAEQLAVLAAVAGVSDRVVVVLANGSAVETASWQHHAGAIVEGWLGGQAGGAAIADVLVGAVNPSGRLAETIPLRLSDTPAYLNFPGVDSEVIYGEGVHVGYRHYDAVGRDVSFPFGHGLSYTTFGYSDLRVDVVDDGGVANWQGAERARVSVAVTNTGEVAGKEVVQLYVAPAGHSVHELRGFAKVDLGPGDRETVSFVLTDRDLARWSARASDWIVEPGAFAVSVGASSRDLRVTAAFDLPGAPPAIPLDRSSSMGEWLAHPVGREVLLEALRTSPVGDLTPLFDDPERLRMLESFPLKRLLPMVGAGYDAADLDRLLTEVDDVAIRRP